MSGLVRTALTTIYHSAQHHDTPCPQSLLARKSDQSILLPFPFLSAESTGNLHPKTVCSPPVPFRPPPCESYHSELISILILIEIDQAFKQDITTCTLYILCDTLTILPGNIEPIKHATLAHRGRLTSYIPHVRQTKR